MKKLQKNDSGNHLKETGSKPAKYLIGGKVPPAIESWLRLNHKLQLQMSKKLCAAIDKRDKNEIKSLMKGGAELNSDVGNGVTPMSRLLASGDAELIKTAREILESEKRKLLDSSEEEGGDPDSIRFRKIRLESIDKTLEKLEG